jgi:hypothetical protein
MYKVLKYDTFNCQHCLEHSTEDTQLKMSPIGTVDYVEMGSRRRWHHKGKKQMKMNLFCFVTLHVLTWHMHNNNHSIQSVDISRIRVALFAFGFIVGLASPASLRSCLLLSWWLVVVACTQKRKTIPRYRITLLHCCSYVSIVVCSITVVSFSYTLIDFVQNESEKYDEQRDFVKI